MNQDEICLSIGDAIILDKKRQIVCACGEHAARLIDREGNISLIENPCSFIFHRSAGKYSERVSTFRYTDKSDAETLRFEQDPNGNLSELEMLLALHADKRMEFTKPISDQEEVMARKQAAERKRETPRGGLAADHAKIQAQQTETKSAEETQKSSYKGCASKIRELALVSSDDESVFKKISELFPGVGKAWTIKVAQKAREKAA